jgi:hypothetical protein
MDISELYAHYVFMLSVSPVKEVVGAIKGNVQNSEGVITPRAAALILIMHCLSLDEKPSDELLRSIEPLVLQLGDMADDVDCLSSLTDRFFQGFPDMRDDYCNVVNSRVLVLVLSLLDEYDDQLMRNLVLCVIEKLVVCSRSNMLALSECTELVDLLVSYIEKYVQLESMLKRLDFLQNLELKPVHLLRLMNLTLEQNKISQKNPYTSRIVHLLHKEEDTHFHMDHSSIVFSLSSSTKIRNYTIQFWIQFNDLEDGDILSIDGKTILRMEASQLSIYYKTRFMGKFDTFDFDSNHYYNIALIHELSGGGDKRRAKLTLYVNGSYVQNMRCPYPFSSDDAVMAGRDSQNFFLTLGSMHCDLSVTGLILLTGAQAYEWIALAFHLGKNYRGGFQDEDLLQFLNYENRTRFNLKLLDISNNSDNAFDLNNLQLRVSKERILLFFNAEHVVYSPDFSLDGCRLSSELHTIIGEVKLFRIQNITEVFYAIAGLQLVFTLIESSTSMESLSQSVKLLFELATSNWKIIREMETINGYQLLATLLRLKKTEFKESLHLDLFDMILKFIGYNFDSPFNSIIMNHLAYDQVILDLQLWKPLSKETDDHDLEIIKFLIFQLTAFTRECKYKSFNIIKLKKLKIVKRILNSLSQGFFPEKVQESLQEALSILVRSNLTPETIKTISSFIIYSLNEGNESNGLLGLKVLSDVYLDPLLTTTTQWKKLFSSASIKYILLLFELGKTNKLIVDFALTLLIKILTMSKKSYEIFIKNNGLHIVLAIMRDIKLDRIEINLLINGSLGVCQTDLNFNKLDNEVRVKPHDRVVIPELHHLIFDLLEWTVLNDIFRTDDHDSIISLIDSYIGFLNKAFEESESFVETFQFDKAYIRRMCNLFLLLNKPRNAGVYFDSSVKVVELLASRVLSKLFKSDLATVEAYVYEVLNDSENGMNGTIPTVYLSLVFPKTLIHLKEFSLEFEVLLQTDSLKFSNIAILLNLLYTELLTFEWASEDYFNYVSVVLSVLEAYKKSGKSLRNTQFIQLQKNITSIMNALVFVLKDSESSEQQENFLKVVMFHQENLFLNGVLSSDGIANIICLLLEIGVTSKPEVSALAINCLRIVLLHSENDLSSICSSITFISHTTALKFLQSVITMSDEEVISQLVESKRLCNLFSNHLDAIVGKLQRKYTKGSFVTAEEQLLSQFNKHDHLIKEKYENIDKLLKLLQNDNEILKQKIVHSETSYLVRFLKDQFDILQFHIAAYNKLKLETTKRLSLYLDCESDVSTWILDSMEGIDRMRKRLLPYDDLEKDQLLRNIVDVPVKKIGDEVVEEPPRVESLSLHSFDMVEADAIEDTLNTYNDKNRKVLKSLFPGDKIVDIWNVSQVVGLEIHEGIVILGQSHIYLIQGYFHKASTDEIIDINDAPENERDPNVKLITGHPTPVAQNISEGDRHPVHHWDLYKLTSVTKRQFLLRDVALELFFSNGASFLVTSIRTRERDAIYSKLSSVATNSNIDNDLSAIFKEANTNNPAFSGSSRKFTTKLSNVFHLGYENVLEATKKWQNGEMSNFYYLVIINTLAGRTFNDLTQYPVFPWVIADYSSEELDLCDPKSFRDLSKPMGAQNPQRAQQFKERYEALQSLDDELSPPFHYGTHYSSAMIVASFLIRLEPFVQSYLLLQGGKFDHADRLFYSIEKAWKSSSSDNTTDVRELIPEFFCLPEFLSNINEYDFGKLQDGTPISDVELPLWAKGDPKIFISKNREALESPYVSEHLHEWVDLIFGFKQTGPKAVEAINVFNHLSYHGAIDLDAINNEVERRSIIGIIHNFGQTPAQIFSKPHPARECLSMMSIDPDKIKKVPLLLYQTKFKEPIHYLQFKTHSDSLEDAFWRGYPKLFLNGEIEIKKGPFDGSMVVNRRTFEKLHDEEITALARVDNEVFMTGSKSGAVHVWRYVVLVKGFKEELDFETKLLQHIDPIKELKISPEFNLLVSLDVKGVCYVWDLAGYKFIRRISTDAEHVAIAYDTGMIAASHGSSVKLFTINGELISEKNFEKATKITALNFANSRTVSTIKINNVESHEYWNHQAILTTGWSDGEICLDELAIGTDGWLLAPIQSLKFADLKDPGYLPAHITIVEIYLKSYVNYEDERGGKIEVVAGDAQGRVAVWR